MGFPWRLPAASGRGGLGLCIGNQALGFGDDFRPFLAHHTDAGQDDAVIPAEDGRLAVVVRCGGVTGAYAVPAAERRGGRQKLTL